jgi:hypothetical protein
MNRARVMILVKAPNKRFYRSAATKSHMVVSMLPAAPAEDSYIKIYR